MDVQHYMNDNLPKVTQQFNVLKNNNSRSETPYQKNKIYFKLSCILKVCIFINLCNGLIMIIQCITMWLAVTIRETLASCFRDLNNPVSCNSMLYF